MNQTLIHTLVAVDTHFDFTFKATAENLAVQAHTTGTVTLYYSVDGVNFIEVDGSETAVVGTDILILNGLVVGLYIKVVSTAAGTLNLL